MPRILPSQVVAAVDSLFGANRNELDGRAVTHAHRAEVHALLALLDEVPRELIDLSSDDLAATARRCPSPGERQFPVLALQG